MLPNSPGWPTPPGGLPQLHPTPLGPPQPRTPWSSPSPACPWWFLPCPSRFRSSCWCWVFLPWLPPKQPHPSPGVQGLPPSHGSPGLTLLGLWLQAVRNISVWLPPCHMWRHLPKTSPPPHARPGYLFHPAEPGSASLHHHLLGLSQALLFMPPGFHGYQVPGSLGGEEAQTAQAGHQPPHKAPAVAPHQDPGQRRMWGECQHDACAPGRADSDSAALNA